MRGFLNACHEIETLAGRIYQKMAAKSSYPDYVRDTFRTLGSEELAHAREIDMVRLAPDSADLVRKLIARAKVEECLETAREFLHRVENQPLSEKEALRMAVALEKIFIRVHAHNALDFTNPRLANLFSNLAESDQLHLDTLRDCLGRWQRENTPASHPRGRG